MKSSRLFMMALLAVGFVVGFFQFLADKGDVSSALMAAGILVGIPGVIMFSLSWGMEIALAKGYPVALGFAIALLLPVLGLVVLALLPAQSGTPLPAR